MHRSRVGGGGHVDKFSGVDRSCTIHAKEKSGGDRCHNQPDLSTAADARSIVNQRRKGHEVHSSWTVHIQPIRNIRRVMKNHGG